MTGTGDTLPPFKLEKHADRPAPPSSWAALGAFLERLGAALLVGGLATTAIVAQIAFRSDDILNREQAGLLAARVFDFFLFVEVGAFVLMAVGSLRGRTLAKHVALFVIVLAILSHIVMGQRMRSLRHQAGGSIERVARGHPLRKDFGRLHGFYVLASAGMLAGAIGVLAAGARRPS